MYKLLTSVLATILLALPLHAATINDVVFNSSGKVVGIDNLEFGGPLGPVYYDVKFTDLGRESVSFNDVFGAGPVEAVRTFERFPFATQGVWNSGVRSAITRVLQRFNPRQNGLFVFPPINSDNNRTVMLLLDTNNDTFLAGTSTETSSNTSALRRDQQLFNTSFAIINEVAAPISPVPLPSAGWMLLASFGGLVVARRLKRS